jgi:hypothetical protein
MKAINGFWGAPRSETTTRAGFRFAPSTNESFTNKTMSKEPMSWGLRFDPIMGGFYWGPPPNIPTEIKESESGGFSFGPPQSIPIKIKEPEPCGFQFPPVMNNPDSTSTGFQFGSTSSIPSKTKDLGPGEFYFGPPLSIQVKIEEPKSCRFRFDPVMDSPSSAKIFPDKSTYLEPHSSVCCCTTKRKLDSDGSLRVDGRFQKKRKLDSVG